MSKVAKFKKSNENPKNIMTFCDLPSEIINKIFGYLSPREILKLNRVCKNFKLHCNAPLLIKRVHFSEMTLPNYPLLFIPDEKTEKIDGFCNFLVTENSKNVTYLDITYDIFQKGLERSSSLFAHLIPDYRTGAVWPCKNLKHFCFVMSAPNHLTDKDKIKITSGWDLLIMNIQINCPLIESLTITACAYPRQQNFKKMLEWFGTLDLLTSWLKADDDNGVNKKRLKKLTFKFSIPNNEKENINNYLGGKC